MSKPWREENILRELYLNQGLTTTEIGNKLDCGEGTVWRWLNKHDIERRNKGPKRTHTELADKAFLESEYIDKKKTAYEIAEDLGCSDVNVYYWLDKHNIQVRDEHSGQILSDERLSDKSWLKEKHYDEMWSYGRIASECGVSDATVSFWMARHGLEYQRKKEEHYGPSWKLKRQKRLEVDSHECVVCGMSNGEHEEQFGRGLDVHHIEPLRTFRDGDKVDFERANRTENLITLCRRCHSRWEGIPLRPQQ